MRSVSTGLYTLWRFDGSTGIGTTTDLPSTVTTRAAAFAACDGDGACAGVTCQATPTGFSNCKMIKGTDAPGTSRTLTRAVPLKLT